MSSVLRGRLAALGSWYPIQESAIYLKMNSWSESLNESNESECKKINAQCTKLHERPKKALKGEKLHSLSWISLLPASASCNKTGFPMYTGICIQLFCSWGRRIQPIFLFLAIHFWSDTDGILELFTSSLYCWLLVFRNSGYAMQLLVANIQKLDTLLAFIQELYIEVAVYYYSWVRKLQHCCWYL